ncbi:WG repeat-containing protein [Mucilaginibacter sp. CAU 1740]|uniref:WG repeat-containing protein n=1 Tax=Mucilaginibacter sp. CAU 1740 TaxID=3140365 RepID=UPI00325AC460
MKTKPIIIATVAIVILAIGAYFIFFRGKSVSSAKESEITLFLKSFNKQIKKGNRDSLLAYFAGQQNSEPVNRLVTALLNKADKDNPEAAFNLELDIDKSGITFTNPKLAVAVIPVTFSGDHLDSKLTSLNITIQKDDDGKYKIYQIDGIDFMKDYLAYQSSALQKNYTDKDIYSPITLKSFADASNLYAKYDSVIWFSHIKNQTYFYVVKGKWDLYEALEREKDTTKTYKMGLVGPDYKEVVPAEYDVIHNISGTFPNLVEVEKEHKKGFYDLTGKTVVPVEYDQVFPINDPENLAALRKGDDYFWLKNDYTISEKADINIGDLFSKLKQPASFTLTNSPAGDITEFNSRDEHGSIYLAPSYLVELNLMPQIKEFKNPLRNHVNFEESSTQYIVKARSLPVNTTAAAEENWLQSAFYSVRDYFISGRSEFYDTRKLVLIDKKHNKFYTQSVSIDNSREGEYEGLSGPCNEYGFRTLTDSLFELKVSSVSALDLYNNKETLQEMPMYHYFTLKDDKLTEMVTGRAFAFTKYLKMDDSYLQGCYTYLVDPGSYPWKQKQSYQLTPQVLQYMKNEIYADYSYKFKDKRWNDIFYDSYGEGKTGKNESVQDSLTEIDKYNIQWIDQKLKSKPVIKKNTLALNN